MASRLIVVFAYHYPPDPATGSLRPARLVKYLKRIGYRVLVVTAARQDNPQPDVLYVPDPFVENPGNSWGWHVDRVIRKTIAPGVLGTYWSGQAVRKALQALRDIPKTTQTTILGTYPPHGTLLAAWRLSRKTGFPWIADFRDPIAVPGLGTLMSSFHVRVMHWLEDRVLNSSDSIIANTDTVRDNWIRKHPELASRVHVLWNGFDPENRIQPNPLPQRDFKLISHAGELYFGRKVDPVLASIDRLIAKGKLHPDRIRVRLVGPVEEKSRPAADLVERATKAGWLSMHLQRVPKQEAQELALSSDGLMIILQQSVVQVPMKLYEYLQIGRPILAYVPPGSPTERILSQSGVPYRCVHPDDSEADFDDAVLSFCSLPSEPVRANSWFEANFSADQQVKTLDALIQSLHSART